MINIKTISQTLKQAIESRVSTPSKAIAGIILLCGLMKRPGLSTLLAVAAVSEKMGVLGLPTGEFSDGTPNHMQQFSYLMFDEVFRQIRERMKIDIVLGPGSSTVQIGPSGTGTNVNIMQGFGNAQ